MVLTAEVRRGQFWIKMETMKPCIADYVSQVKWRNPCETFQNNREQHWRIRQLKDLVYMLSSDNLNMSRNLHLAFSYIHTTSHSNPHS